ncbi:RHS repeat domain-containing protein [Pseudomonas sp. CCC3.1]|uniref:RHS repeat domain-containing protein n=1 Tax=Pseudomonas sp. CCC3.1 TaxID=3048607 RepID=UPI002AC8C442|nr:RHS repeat domain-containing protein [Pseudomonas sp. CCC3.1]MEB0205598.1 RHS repeat protein [Pseudomonas sp. CCC3.1]WPX38326.1 RHS repeat domain-containing protein [Pseudomonas sp. CCC3.1]
MRSTETTVHQNTPSLTVLDNRGLAVRDISYHRHPAPPDVIGERITRHRYDARGFLAQSVDPRLHDAGLVNFTYLTDLAGKVLRTQGADNGTTVTLNDAAGRPFMVVCNIFTADDDTENWSQAVTRTFQYEGDDMAGRLLSITEQTADGVSRITERFVYAGNTEAEKDLNLTGQCVSHYDSAGLLQRDGVALTDVPLSVTRRLPSEADSPDTVADWQGENASAWNGLLAAKSYTTLTTADATGAVLTNTDAAGNQQRVAYDVAGLLSGSWLTVKGATEQVIVKSLTWSAAGQKLREEHGNGVVTAYTYEPEGLRLTGIKTERPPSHASGAKVLQDLRYEYDPVGNVLSVRNDAEETRFWRNQKVVPENTYIYDSLYQLVSASGREMASSGQQGSGLPPVSSFDNVTYTNYTRTYSYDSAGNLTQVRHSAPATGNNYTTGITISERSNRGVLSTLTENAAEVEALFTAGGQQIQLQPGQLLAWTARNELLKVTPLVRDGGADDGESYRYDAGSQRVLKVGVQKTAGSVLTQRVLYLSGLELRATTSGDRVLEDLQVITVGEAGRAQVRLLHWESEKPGVSNDQLRYSYDNLIGSSCLEVDGDGKVISQEEYYPYGGAAVWIARSQAEASYKTVRYSGKERDATGLFYYGYRYYQPWAGRWLSADPAGTVDGLNLFRMCRNNPIKYQDDNGLMPNNALAGASATTDRIDDDINLVDKIRSIFLPLLREIAITDIPYRNNNGLTQYRHDENHSKVRERRVKVARELGMSLGDAVNDREFQLSLANRVANERDDKNKLFGQCTEMAYLSASKLEEVARDKAYNVFTFQQPDANHTITLFSKNNYKPGEMINWKKEKSKGSLVVDLWQGVLSPDSASALVNYSHDHRYTNNNPRSIVQAKIWGFSNVDDNKSGKVNMFKKLRSLLK